MIWAPWHDLRVRAAAGVTVLALALAVRAASTAFAEPRVAPAAPLIITASAVARFAPPQTPLAQLVALDPFGLAELAPDAAPSAAIPPIVLVGTFAGVGAPTAICRLGVSPARILHLGDTLGGWRLQQVSPGLAVFIDGAAVRHELRLSPVGK